jgi:crotonobetainyl-CoA:carnitine CoA-transferase CaiB-like acyl-CoA transferase
MTEHTTTDTQATPRLPYEGLRVVEFTHMVMGPTCGMVLADLGAEVIKVEPIGHGREGDATRQLIGSGSGFFPMFNRNKKVWRWIFKRQRAWRLCSS